MLSAGNRHFAVILALSQILCLNSCVRSSLTRSVGTPCATLNARRVAQRLEQGPYKALVGGSTPSPPTGIALKV